MSEIIVMFILIFYKQNHCLLPSIHLYFVIEYGLIPISGINMVPLKFMSDIAHCIKQLMNTMANNKEVYRYIFT